MAGLNLPLTAHIMIENYMRAVFAKLATLGNIDALSYPFEGAEFIKQSINFLI